MDYRELRVYSDEWSSLKAQSEDTFHSDVHPFFMITLRKSTFVRQVPSIFLFSDNIQSFLSIDDIYKFGSVVLMSTSQYI
jgi:hypothetical protein